MRHTSSPPTSASRSTPSAFSRLDWFLSIRHEDRIEASPRHAYYPAAAGLVLDLMKALGGNPATVAINLGGLPRPP